MLRAYAPVPGTASRSPGRISAGRNSSFTRMSPDSQCFPTTRARIGLAVEARPATVALYAAPDSVDAPMIARPGSIESRGIGRCMAVEIARTTVRMPRANSAGLDGRSCVVYAMPIPDRGDDLQDSPGGQLEPTGVEDLRSDVGVEAPQLERALGQDLVHRRGSRSARDREAELLILVGG